MNKLAAALILMSLPAVAQEASELPKEKPATATAFLECGLAHPTFTGVVAVVITYPSGKVVWFDEFHMHGLQDSDELLKYARSADQQQAYAVGCDEHGNPGKPI